MDKFSIEDELKQYDGYYTIGQVQEQLKKSGVSKPIPTIRNWVNDMHQFQLHTLPRNSRGERIFREIDIEIIRFIAEAKRKYGNSTTMQMICTMIQNSETFNEHLHYDPNDGGATEESSLILPEHRLKEYLREELEQLQQLKDELTTAKENYESQIKMLPNPEQEKEMRDIEMRTLILNTRSMERKIRARLRERAEDEWSKNPVKRGFIIKAEDNAAKVLFIDKYIEEHFDIELQIETDKQNS